MNTIALIPFGILTVIGLFIIIFPATAVLIKDFRPSFGGTIFRNNLEVTRVARISARIAGFIILLSGVYILLLIGFDIDVLGIAK